MSQQDTEQNGLQLSEDFILWNLCGSNEVKGIRTKPSTAANRKSDQQISQSTDCTSLQERNIIESRGSPTTKDHMVMIDSLAYKTFPPEIQLCWSSIPGYKLGVIATSFIPQGVWIGPYLGKLVEPDKLESHVDVQDGTNLWEIFYENRLLYYVDGSDVNTSGWMRFIQCARSYFEQNLNAFQYHGYIYYRTMRDIHVGEELLVWYDNSYPQYMGIPLMAEPGDDIETRLQTKTNTKRKLFDTQKTCSTAERTKILVNEEEDISAESQKSNSPVNDNKTSKLMLKDSVHEDYQVFKSMQEYEENVPSTVSESRIESLSPRGSCNGTDIKHGNLKCGQCSKSFLQRNTLQMHVCPKQTTSPYQCGYCNLTFTNPSDLRSHVLKHVSEKPFKCGFCMRSFVGATTLNNHIRIHTGEKSFNCRKCGVTFSQGTQYAYIHTYFIRPLYQPILCNHGSCGLVEPTAKRIKMNDRTFKVSFQDLQDYLFGKRKLGVAIDSDKTINESANQKISKITKDMPNIVRLCLSSIPSGTGYGIQATETIPIGAWIGPYQGNFVEPNKASGMVDSSYLWEIFKDGKLYGYIDGSDENTASWMRFIRCARHEEEQNLYAFQYMNKIYYRTYKTIEPGQELLVWYDQMYTQYMGIPCEGIYDIASSNGASHVFETSVKVAQDKIPTPPTTPTKSTDNPFTNQSLNVASPNNKTPITSPSDSSSSESSTQPIKRLKFPEDVPITNQNETRKRVFGFQPNGSLSNTDENQAKSLTASNPKDHFATPISVKLNNAQPQAVDPKTTQLQCGQCKQVFIQRSILQTHICAGVLLKPYQCGHCNETFSNPGLMRLHAVTHQGKKPFKCGFCMRSFSGASTLNNHIRTHTGEKPFHCLKCGKSFTKGLQLSRHILMCPGTARLVTK
ncbi:uncharacterized protein LOC116303633 [Actinia tenebrosa]|uniref:Uncharacterized protein LOC116303633 n=1 Tax=Actinia tenebrosa TaxID=6105 RepID=A0A6P8IQ84_ACTTE|nr:uncharacterized protein LOC116303633 [Actinia tenebrosa]